MQNGQAVATVDAPVSRTWRVRAALMRVPRVSSIHIRPPPRRSRTSAAAVLHLPSSTPGIAPSTSRGAAITPL